MIYTHICIYVYDIYIYIEIHSLSFSQCHALHNKALRAPGGLAHSEVEVLGAKVVYNCPLCCSM